MNRASFLQRGLAGASLAMRSACATVQPTESAFIEPGQALQAKSQLDRVDGQAHDES